MGLDAGVEAHGDENVRCVHCAHVLLGRSLRKSLRRGVRLAHGTLSTDELLCRACYEALPAPDRAEWLPLDDGP